jgi:hypothetical protein
MPADARLEVDVLKPDLLMLPQPGFGITGRRRPKFNRLLGFLTGKKVRSDAIASE